MPRLQAVVRVLTPCKPCGFDFLVWLGVCRMKMTIFGFAEAEKICPYRLLGEIPAEKYRQKAVEVNLHDNSSL